MRFHSCSLQTRQHHRVICKEESRLVDVVLRSSLDASLLQPKDGLVCGFTGEIRICAEPFPVAAALCDATHVHHRAEGNIDALCFEFLAQRQSARTNESTVPSGGMSLERSLKRTITYVDAAVMAAGKTVTKSVKRTPSGESLKILYQAKD